MKKITLFIAVLCISNTIQAQHSSTFIIRSEKDHLPLAGASVIIKSTKQTFIADSAGQITLTNIPGGKQILLFSYVGQEEKEVEFVFPLAADSTNEIVLAGKEDHEEDVIVTATRTSRTIKKIPTRVEIISGEELSEKGNMKPGDIRMLLNESTGIQTQQTSATSYNSSIRIQGLDGRYTQILKDGFPLYAGFSGGLSLMQIAPLDLKQIEVIKGSSSTLYGGGAIAGLVNLVSKTPGTKRELSFLTNATSAGGIDVSGFYSQRFKKIGVTVFGSRNSARAYDPANIGLTAIPKFERFTINPRFFLYDNNITANIGFNFITESRVGGSTDYIRNGAIGYFEKNNTDRFNTQAELTYTLSAKSRLNFKNSYSKFNRKIEIPSYLFEGVQQSSFTEISYNNNQKDKFQWLVGLNFLTDDFSETKHADSIRNYHYNTFGIFTQNTWTISERLTVESGLRTDFVNEFGVELLPRISALIKIDAHFTARIGGGMGYKTPTVFTEDAEKNQFQKILPIDQSKTKNERSAGANLDINFRTKINDVGISVNQLFFYTRLNHPLILTAAGNNYEFINAPGHIDTRGLETNIKLTYEDFKLFFGYTYADVNNHFNNVKSWFPLTARHRLNNVLMYEKEGKLKIGLEAYYFSKQKLNDGTIRRSYWTFGLMGEKSWGHVSVFINFENFTDTRQTRFGSIYIGSINNPSFKDIYAPVDGFVINGGIKIKL